MAISAKFTPVETAVNPRLAIVQAVLDHTPGLGEKQQLELIAHALSLPYEARANGDRHVVRTVGRNEGAHPLLRQTESEIAMAQAMQMNRQNADVLGRDFINCAAQMGVKTEDAETIIAVAFGRSAARDRSAAVSR